ncbi:MAG TPA: UvrD-helicase domain-containing protein [Bacteroidia bacterium]|jgi:ATP-dependent exoDNAse (exonuclease V) beta subunit|nr:UvrD-helicase domain-containing protein [Bacteroidia bacterium]
MGNFVVYKSSAGSGKTYTLVKEYLKLALADPHRLHSSFKHILAVTFTNKAAAEMKERVLKALFEISTGEKIPLSSDLQKEMQISESDLQARCEELHTNLLHQYADFSVCTIDSFVYRIVRRFSLDLKLPANFSVETDEETPLWWAIDNLLTDMQQNEAVQKLLKDYADEKVDEQKNWNIENEIFELAKSILVSKKDAAGVGLLQQQEINNLVKVKELLKTKTKEVEGKLTLLAEKAFLLIEKNNISVNEFYYKDKGLFGYFNKVRDRIYDSEELLKSYVLKTITEDVWYTGKTANTAIDSVKEELRTIFNEIETYREKVSKDYYLHTLLLKNINALCVLSELKLLVEQYKTEKNIVFISEFNKAIAGFISEEPVPYIYERLGDRYKHYLIDEFQDTSALQWLNLLPLVHNSLAEGKLCMLVGDGKQSIYRWRGADVEQFANLPRVENKEKSVWIDEQQQALQTQYTEKYLNINRRSCAEVISFNNSLFEYLAGKNLVTPYTNVYNHSSQEAASKQGGKISLSFIKEEKDIAEQRVLDDILKHIENSLQNKYSYTDIAILVRKNKDGNKIANYLLRKSVPVVSSDSLLLKNCPEVNFINSFLSWLINHNDAVSATAVIGYLKEISFPGIKHETIQKVSSRPFGLNEILASLQIIIEVNHLTSLSLFELCTETLRLFKLESKNPLYLNFFLDEVSNFSQRESNSVFAFLAWWKQKSANLSVKIPANTNAVKVLTIHSSKGLEFPVVIFPFADWKIDKPENILIDTSKELPSLPVALVKTGSTLKKTVFEEQSIEEEQKQKLDNLNLLYVACTRAVDELHIIARESSQGGKTITAWLKEFATVKHNLKKEENFIEIGESLPKEHGLIKDIPHLQPASYRPLHEAVTIKLSDCESEISSRRLMGIAVHNILAEIKTAEDILPAMQKALLQGNINTEQMPFLKSAIEHLTKHPLLSAYFSEGAHVKTETELFTNEGDIIRPDRVIILPSHLVVIDFKTGEKKPEHKKQIEQYQYALKKISGKEVKAFLIYLPSEGHKHESDVLEI